MRCCLYVLVALALLVGLLPAWAQTGPERPGFDSPPQVLARAALGGQPGTAVVAVWHRGQVWQAGLRDGVWLSDDELLGARAPVFQIASISKVFTGLLLAQSVERGELSLDDTLGQRLKGVVDFWSAAAAAITLRQLVTHTACLPRLPADFGSPRGRGYRDYDRARLWAALADLKLAQVPPCTALYSNLGFAVLGELISLRLGQSWGELVRERITGPLQMPDTALVAAERQARVPASYFGSRAVGAWPMQAFAGAGGLQSSAADLLRLGRALMAGPDGPLGAAAQRLVSPLLQEGAQTGYGLMIRGPEARRTWMHDGLVDGFRSLLMVAPDRDQVLVVLVSNGASPMGAMQRALLVDRYPVRLGTAPFDAQRLADYAGVYRAGTAPALTAVVQDGALWVRLPGQGFDRLQPAQEDAFTLAGHTRLDFVRADGRVTAVRAEGLGVQRELARSRDAAPAVARQPADLLRPYVGRYVGGSSEASVQLLDGVLRVQLDRHSRFAVYPAAGQPDRFDFDVLAAGLQFQRYGNGQVRAVVVHENGESRTLNKAD